MRGKARSLVRVAEHDFFMSHLKDLIDNNASAGDKQMAKLVEEKEELQSIYIRYRNAFNELCLLNDSYYESKEVIRKRIRSLKIQPGRRVT